MSEALEQDKLGGESAAEAQGPARRVEAHAHGFGDANADHDHHDHGPSYKLLTLVFVTLLALTWLTVHVVNYDFGYNGNLILAMAIATVKVAVVGLWFMHLRYDPPIFGFTLLLSFAFVALFIIFTLLDTSEVLYRVQEAATTSASQ
ncbi:cytochrome C oxidase subunit IV family protein [Phycisphaera mikurensis]|uniref:Cytochrome c oxidase subunit IV n=1 Tax=Phycisphaera mikurensis (strain NBRC 102666 / KCTC 22515 / FYK2301M01) TaxID=1142394 RepID=I0IIL8_PHYMF|nr:cytochrome C oxidase subunit IV family protein [Phycisphaera mikurensis]MBB6442742.1 cytochrome c oxidase subunit 4 [Phycisphaera mikurensis]BAM05106.1 cytochrome c oxidase subunit IV [Phycisphaera mikurensis NBRC 102666]